MKLAKIMAGVVASALAASSLAVTASASFVKPDGVAAGTTIGTGDVLIQLYNVGSEEEGKPAVNYGIDLTKVSSITCTFTVFEEEQAYWEGEVGGAVILSCNGGDIEAGSDLYDTYNWPQQEYWGVIDADLGLESADLEKPLITEKIGDYTYSVTLSDVVNPLVVEDSVSEIGCMQACFKDWSSGMAQVVFLGMEVSDAEGNLLISFDELGNVVECNATAPAPDTDTDTDSDADADTDTNEPTTGDSTKPGPNTGVEGVAVVAGVAVLATGAVVVAKKRK